jgi:hypothetical protein
MDGMGQCRRCRKSFGVVPNGICPDCTYPRVGSLVYATTQGLGVLARDFHQAGVVSDVAVVHHGKRLTHVDWYPGAIQVTSLRSQDIRDRVRRWCLTMDAMLFFETPFLWDLIPWCRDNGVRTFLMPMFECMRERLEQTPDRFVNPSHLDQRYYPSGTHIPVPVPDAVKYRKRGVVTTFVHNAGHGGLLGRNGTAQVIEAWRHVRSGARLILRSQERLPTAITSLSNVEVRVGDFPWDTLYDEGEVFLFPERFNGLSLPLQEARAAGMVVMCGARFPMTEWLPHEALIPVRGYHRVRVGNGCNLVDDAIIDPRDIALTVDQWYGRDAGPYSESSVAWRESMSWGKLKPRYIEELALPHHTGSL